MKPLKSIIITTGDINGIGLEVCAKSISKFIIPSSQRIIVIRSKNSSNQDIRRLRTSIGKTETIVFNNLKAAVKHSGSQKIIQVESNESPAFWIREVALCMKEDVNSFALATGPLSKQEIKNSGINAVGHTEILKEVFLADAVFMAFVGKFFNVVLATGHIEVKNIETALDSDILNQLLKAIQNTDDLFSPNKPIGILGLNPHAGDDGIIGRFDQNTLQPLIGKWRASGLRIEGPLVPDVAFQQRSWKKYSTYVALYHDQGLIPFKMAHGFRSGVHVSLGLPIIRTSVDHGTAKDIYGKAKADPTSMYEAICLASKLLKKRG